jgi:two-component system LytT family response regulator
MNNLATIPANDPIRVVIADDEPLARQLLERLVAAQSGLTVVGSAEDGESARQVIRDQNPDLVFLDIMMPKVNGIELMESFGSSSARPYIVFVTAFDNYAIKAFDLDALDYLVKPIERERFAQSIARARTAICAKRIQQLGEKIAAVSGKSQFAPLDDNEPFVIVRQRDELIRIRKQDIYWLEAASQYVRIHTKSAHYIVAEPLNKYHEKLSSNAFVRVHRSAVVNTAKVRHVMKRQNGVHVLQLANGASVPLSRSRRSLVNEFLVVCAES